MQNCFLLRNGSVLIFQTFTALKPRILFSKLLMIMPLLKHRTLIVRTAPIV